MNDVQLDPQQVPARAELLLAAELGEDAPGRPIYARPELEQPTAAILGVESVGQADSDVLTRHPEAGLDGLLLAGGQDLANASGDEDLTGATVAASPLGHVRRRGTPPSRS